MAQNISELFDLASALYWEQFVPPFGGPNNHEHRSCALRNPLGVSGCHTMLLPNGPSDPKSQTVVHGILHDMMLTIRHLCHSVPHPQKIGLAAKLSMAFDFLGSGFKFVQRTSKNHNQRK